MPVDFRSILLLAAGAASADPTPVNSHHIQAFARGILAVVLLSGLIVAITSSIWAWKTNPNEITGIGQKQLHFAAAILTGLGLLFALAMAMCVWGGQQGKEVFDACKIGIPPIVTFVLGYYFTRDGQTIASTPLKKPPKDTVLARSPKAESHHHQPDPSGASDEAKAGYWAVYGEPNHQQLLGKGRTESDAWTDAAKKLTKKPT
jgi:hypothetical protein